MTQDSYIITGPTASGKSDFAHSLAARTGGVIINCDSVQLYRGIENISASPFAGRPISDNIDGIPYRLFSVLDLSCQISVADYIAMAHRAYDAARAAGRPAIFVGGTGYYINAITSGLSPLPDIDADVRVRAREMVAADIVAARQMLPSDFRFTDPQRVSRALEVFLQTGRHLSEFQSMPRAGAIVPHARKILILPPTDVLRRRIASRVPKMIAGGAIDEGRAVLAALWDENRAIGASQVCKFLRGEVSQEECISEWITRTCQYAKRQRTWFRTQFAADVIISNTPTDNDITAAI